MVITDTLTIVEMPDGTLAALERSMSWGDQAVIMLLVAILFVQVVQLWIISRRAPSS